MVRGEGSRGRTCGFLLMLFIRDCGSLGTDVGVPGTQEKQELLKRQW